MRKTRKGDGLLHVQSKDRDRAAEAMAEAVEKLFRDLNPGAPRDSVVCAGCVVGGMADATKLLVDRHSPALLRAHPPTRDDIIHLLERASRRGDDDHGAEELL